jgi:hypothetical protein
MIWTFETHVRFDDFTAASRDRREISMAKNSRAVQDVLVFDLRLLISAC